MAEASEGVKNANLHPARCQLALAEGVCLPSSTASEAVTPSRGDGMNIGKSKLVQGQRMNRGTNANSLKMKKRQSLVRTNSLWQCVMPTMTPNYLLYV